MDMSSASDYLKRVRVRKLKLLGVMLHKLSQLYPQFSDTVTWVDAHELLADFCFPEWLRNSYIPNTLFTDIYYLSRIANQLGVSIEEVQLGFYHASKSEKSLTF